MEEKFNKNEKLYRMVLNKPNFWKTELGRPTSAVFKDSKGVSVDRDGGRDDESITSSFIKRFGSEKVKAIVYVDVDFCHEIDTHLVYAPLEDNPYHAEIHDSPNKIALTSSKARKLAKHCKIVYYDE